MLAALRADAGADVWALVAQGLEQAGQAEEAGEACRRALTQGVWLAPHRRMTTLDRLARLRFLSGHPLAGPTPWGRLGAMARGEQVMEGPPLFPDPGARALAAARVAGWREIAARLADGAEHG
jgi:hypothetical protein